MATAAPQGTEERAPDTAADTQPAPPASTAAAPLRADSTLAHAVAAFDEYMLRKGFSDNTIKAFRNDLKIVQSYLGEDARLHSVTTAQLHEFLEWLQHGRGTPCSAKTLARRITTLKVYFGWLHGVGVLGVDPAEPILQQPARPPLPSILLDDEINKVVRTAQNYLWDRSRPDARPYLLVSLLLQTGMKKAECARLLIEDIDTSQGSAPELHIRYPEESNAHKNRTISLHPSIVSVVNQYVQQYKPEHYLFECTPRNLEYVLDEVGQKAGIKRIQVGFEALRWTCAVRDYRMGAPEERLRQKLGLSKISWRETREKIFQLAGR